MPRVGLTRAAVTAVAVDVVDEGGTAGFDTLTLAAVAGRAGVAVPSLYKHVASLGDLRRLVATESVAELTRTLAAATIGRAGPDAIRAAADAMRDFARRQPGRYAATQVAADRSDPADDELSARSAETLAVLAGVLRGFGLPDDELVDAVRMLRSAIHGFVTLELGGGFGLPDDLDRSYAVLVDGVIAGVERLAATSPAP
ncbi:TetR-like C-terminal domain-containing protein [Leifsonia sp. NPDC077715]|uniref:TetR-like C-terminal domain-containing protein n=1 Tax=Leifsonia sp. NPDC077715 TaxID=3155539 RepID=UPI00343D3C1F